MDKEREAKFVNAVMQMGKGKTTEPLATFCRR